MHPVPTMSEWGAGVVNHFHGIGCSGLQFARATAAALIKQMAEHRNTGEMQRIRSKAGFGQNEMSAVGARPAVGGPTGPSAAILHNYGKQRSRSYASKLGIARTLLSKSSRSQT